MSLITYLRAPLIACVLFCTLNSYSQSEQETMSWLSQKLTAYLKPHTGVYGGVGFTNLKVVAVDPCAITITFEQKNLIRNKLFYTMTLVLPTDGISISDTGIIQYKDAVITYTTQPAPPNVQAKTKTLTTTHDIFIENVEADILPKIQNAMHQAAAFCHAN